LGSHWLKTKNPNHPAVLRLLEEDWMADRCKLCCDAGWVCENHPDRPWGDYPNGCECGAGMPCRAVIGQTKASAHECRPASRQHWTATEARSTDNNWHRMPDEAHFISDTLFDSGRRGRARRRLSPSSAWCCFGSVIGSRSV
jgi:hypothetical protein